MTLPERIREYAHQHGLTPDHALVQAGRELETVLDEEFDALRTLAAWAKARRLWRTATGERLV